MVILFIVTAKSTNIHHKYKVVICNSLEKIHVSTLLAPQWILSLLHSYNVKYSLKWQVINLHRTYSLSTKSILDANENLVLYTIHMEFSPWMNNYMRFTTSMDITSLNYNLKLNHKFRHHNTMNQRYQYI